MPKSLTFSPSDLTAYLECHHLARLELEIKRGERTRPIAENLHAELIRRKGEEHEEAYLQRLLAEGRDVVAISIEAKEGTVPKRGLSLFDWERAVRETEEALRTGREAVWYDMTWVKVLQIARITSRLEGRSLRKGPAQRLAGRGSMVGVIRSPTKRRCGHG